ncbi:Tat pathway signal sequence domain protein [Pseudomonas sp. NPDC089752]|uniref:Tat pathway signal sequence domain protein n=1 Tax=Pseudomonas sp. NPDC089752 TaxID=3364472 RepID=UPI003816ACE3
MFVTADCTDPDFAKPVIDSREDLQSPIPLHRVSGHFEGTDAKFSFYFPPKSQWQGRFFQKVYPLGAGVPTDQILKFNTESGAYTVETISPSGYRANAAAAKFSKVIARDYYQTHEPRIYGYIYGGSGGSYQTIAAVENSSGVWDGAVPFVIGLPTSIPTNFFVRAFARLVLGDKAIGIADAMSPGGSGDPYVGLDTTEAAAFREVTAMGVPVRGWDNYAYLLGLNDPKGLMGFASTVKGIDPTYADDFWSKPGYLGTEDSPLGKLVREAKVDQTLSITAIDRGEADRPIRIHLANVPATKNAQWLEFSLDNPGHSTPVKLEGALDPATGILTLAPENDRVALDSLKETSRVHVSNRWPIALTTYHRHQIPTSGGFTEWDQFLKSDGSPLYPQRQVLAGKLISTNVSGGGTHTGQIHAKMIVISNALDVDAYPWHADWYAQRLKQHQGSHYKDNVRVWLNDNADHLDGSVIGYGAAQSQVVRLIDYNGILEQAVRDVSAWAERGIAPPVSTEYKVADGQVRLPRAAADRRGIQPVVELTSSSGDRITVAVNSPVTLVGHISVPPGAGKVVQAEWSASGRDDFVSAQMPTQPLVGLTLQKTFTYSKPGVYYPVLRVTSQREGLPQSEFGRVKNLARLRVVVE